MGLLKKIFRKYRVSPDPSLPPFSTGAIGYFAYECKDYLEERLRSRFRAELSVPEIYFLFFDASIVWDHAKHRIHWCQWKDRGWAGCSPGPKEWRKKFLGRKKVLKIPAKRKVSPRMELGFSMDEKAFSAAVNQAKTYIRQGEIFQANLSHRISFKSPEGARPLYARLREVNPSSFFGILEGEDFEIISGSPERLLRLEGRSLETRPIAGTRARGNDPVQDEALSLDLFLSEKERAEHVMLVDLERNDLGRVCDYGSVQVDEFMTLENYSHVKHIVSNVRGTLREGFDAFDAFKAFFPGGTITGAPKIRCMQIIDELETVPRGPYTGSLGYLSFSGDMDFNILIRSLVLRDGMAWLNVGSGIVADSDPKKEYHETLHKAKAVLQAVFGEKNVREFYERRGITALIS
jgi:para-aminobenzoate synthetase component 1